MANYNVGNIEVGVISSSNQVVMQIDQLLSQINKIERLDKAIQDSFVSINRLGNGLNKISKINMNNIFGQFEKISQATKILNERLGALEQPKFGETAQALNRLGNAFRQFDKLKNFDFRAMYNSFNSLNRIIAPFLDKLKQSEASLVAMASVLSNLKARTITNAQKEMDKLDKSTNSANNSTNKLSKGYKKLFNLGKIYFLFNYTKRILQVFGKIISSAVDFDETLNKFQTSFGEYTQNARAYANELTRAFSLSTESILNYMATFNNMLIAFGDLDKGTTTELSKTLTRMSLDYASLFNVSVETAMTQFQSVLSGSVRPIRGTSGYDVSETSIYALYQQLGGTKTMRQLTQLEKRLLRILAIQKQMSETRAVGDLVKTLDDSLSNRFKQISETTKELGIWIGALITSSKWFQNLMDKSLAVLIVLKEITKSFAILNGYTDKQYKEGSAFEGFTDSVSEANDEIDELTNKLLSFDKFEVLQQSNNANQGMSSDLEMLVKSIASYDENLSQISSRASDIATKILKWLGFTDDLNEETGDVSWTLNDVFNKLELIVGAIQTLLTLGIIKGITGYITKTQMLKAEMTILQAQTGANITSFSLLNSIMSSLLIVAIANLIFNFDKMSKTSRILSVAIITVSTAIMIFKNRLAITKAIGKFITALKLASIHLDGLYSKLLLASAGAIALGAAFYIFANMDQWSAKTKTFVGVLATLAGALMTVAAAWLAIRGIESWGTAIPAIVGGVALGIAGITSLVKGVNEGIGQFGDGGFPTKGNLFIANERGPELVGNIGGRTAVANNDMIVQAIENASYRGYARAMHVQSQNKDRIAFDFSGTNDSALARLIARPLVEELRSQGYEIRKA